MEYFSLKRSTAADRGQSNLSSKVYVRSTKSGKVQKIVRELYLRQDIPCSSTLCRACLEIAPADYSKKTSPFVLSDTPAGSKHFPNGQYLVPDTNAFLTGMDLFEVETAFHDVIVLQTVLEEVKNRSLPLYHRLISLTKNEGKRFYVFFNEFRQETNVVREPGETINDRNDRAVRKAVQWYNQHITDAVKARSKSQTRIPTVVMITDDRDNLRKAKSEDVPGLTLSDFVSGLENSDELLDMISAAQEQREVRSKKAEVFYSEHYSVSKMMTGVKAGTLHQGIFNVSPYNYLEGSVHVPAFDKSLLILGRENSNRAVSGDVVVVEVLPQDQWKAPSTKIIEEETVNKNDNAEAEEGENVIPERERRALQEEVKRVHGQSAEGRPQPTARVVGIIKRNWRQYVGHIDRDSVRSSSKSSRQQQTVFLVPMDKRIPKIRIRTRQAGELLGQRVLATIDSWEKDSRYPVGHFVRSLGELESKGAETEALLLEWDVQYKPFPKTVLDCLPAEGHDWKVPANMDDPATTMSFGCSPSDVLKLLEFSTRVYLAFKDANENSEAQVAGLVKEFTAFHTCLVELGELMKQYGQPMPFPVKEFEATLKRCEKTLDPYADHLVDKKMGVKKFIFTIRYMGMEKEIDGLRKQITGHYQALHMCISFLQLRLHLEATKQTQRLLDAAPPRTVTLGGRAYSTSALGFSSQHTPLSLPAPDEHPLFSEWVIFDRWLQSEDERIAREAEHSRPLSLGDTPAALPSDDDQTAAILYHLRRQVDDAILIEENRTKRMTAEKRSHLSPSDAIRQEVRNMPPAPSRTYTLDTDHSGNFTGFGQHQMSSSSETARPSLSIPLSHSPPSVGPRGDSYFGSIDWAQSPTDTSASYDAGRTSVSTNRSSMSHSPGSQPRSSSADLSPGGTIPETLASYSLRRSLSRTSLATMALGEAALDWKRICRSVEVERKSVKYGAESRDCDVRWRYREDTGISIRAVYHSSQDGKLRTWIEQHFPATGPSIPLTTTYPDGAVSIDFPRNSFGKLDKQYTDIKYTFSASDSAEKFQTLLYTNNSADAADLKFDRPILTISSDKNPTECRGRNLRLWHRTETHLEDDGPVAFDVLVLLFYTSALEERGHWVEEPHYAFEWLTDACMKKESEKLTLVFSKDASRWKSDKLFQRRKSSGASTVAVPRSPASPSSSSSFFSPRKRNDSMEIPQLTRAGTKASVASNESFKTALTSAAHPGRLGNLNRFGYSELEIKFQSKKDRRAFLEVWAEFVKPLR